MLQFQNRELYSTIFGFQKDKLILLMSIFHHDGNTDRETSIEWKPDIETFYKKTKGGVDVDKLCSNYHVT